MDDLKWRLEYLTFFWGWQWVADFEDKAEAEKRGEAFYHTWRVLPIDNDENTWYTDIIT